MAEIKLEVKVREGRGKGAARRARAAGLVPGVIYGRGMEPVAVEVDRRAFLTALNSDAGLNTLFDLRLAGKEILALTKDLQRDPVRGAVLHADFIQVDRKQEVEVEVPVHVVGEAAGVKEGGVLEQPLFHVTVRCPVTDVPEAIEADVTALNQGDSLRVSDLQVPGGYAVLNDPDSPVVTIAAPVSEAELEAMEAAAGIEAEAPEEAAEGEPGADERASAEEERTSDETEPSETTGSE
ncbi:MAG TPA: 50S ribosomal protein L25/general stress protein Ctc [Actinomycetota bacterium]|nr:50S ribosomal protein L25/general stress protein Ctc [Actinomycetota bacterium]